MSDYLSDSDYNFIYSKVPRICVDLLFKREDGKILLTKRRIEPYVGCWHFPGGRIKFRETIDDAIDRIANAEIGFNSYIEYEIVGSCEFLEEYQQNNPRHSISLVCLIEVNNYVQVNDGEWFDAIPEQMIPPQKEFLIQNNIL